MAKFKGSNSSDTSEASPLSLVSGVMAENYRDLGRSFMGSRGGSGFVIATENGKWQGVAYSQTLRQWGAWLAFFRSRKIPHSAMLNREFYTVPAEWPHEFTTDATVQEDHRLGDAFQKKWLNDRANEHEKYGTAAQRLATITAFKAQVPRETRKRRTLEDHLVAPEIDPPGLDREALFRSHDEAVAK